MYVQKSQNFLCSLLASSKVYCAATQRHDTESRPRAMDSLQFPISVSYLTFDSILRASPALTRRFIAFQVCSALIAHFVVGHLCSPFF